jgi:hypothetical protein
MIADAASSGGLMDDMCRALAWRWMLLRQLAFLLPAHEDSSTRPGNSPALQQKYADRPQRRLHLSPL